MKAKFYIRFHNYWQGTPDYFAGPFASRADAEAEIDRANAGAKFNFVRGDLGQLAPDVRHDIRIAAILMTTQARKVGMKTDWKHDPDEVNTVPYLCDTEEASNYNNI